MRFSCPYRRINLISSYYCAPVTSPRLAIFPGLTFTVTFALNLNWKFTLLLLTIVVLILSIVALHFVTLVLVTLPIITLLTTIPPKIHYRYPILN